MDKSLHSHIWWNTYSSLNRFYKIRIRYWLTFLSFWFRKLRAIVKNKYEAKYFDHPRITIKQINEKIETIRYGN